MNYNEINLKEELKKLKYEEDTLNLNNVIPINIFTTLGGDYKNINILGGRDMDYEGVIKNYHIFGSALYGTCSICLNNAKSKPNELIQKEKDNDKFIRFKATSYNKIQRPTT